MTAKKVAIIGAGMAGLSASYYLNASGFDTTVFEKRNTPGGRTRSFHQGEFIMDMGAITLATNYTHTLELLKQAGAHELVVPGPMILGLAREGELHELDLSSPRRLVASRFLSPGAKIKLLALLPDLIRYWRRSGFSGMTSLAEIDNQNCREYAVKTCGQEVHDYFVDPILRLNMFNQTEKASRVDLQWLLKIFSGAQILQVKGGMGSMSKTLSQQLVVENNSKVHGIRQCKNKVLVEVNDSTHEFDAAVVATPATQAIKLVTAEGPHFDWFNSLSSIGSLTVHLCLSYRPETAAGICMMPSCEQSDIIAFALDHNKCDDRAPVGKSLLTLHMTTDWADRHDKLSDEEIAHEAALSLQNTIYSGVLGDIKNNIEFFHLHRWQHVDHSRYVGCYKALEQALPAFNEGRIQYAGEYISAGIEGAVISGKRSASALSSILENSR